MSSTHEDLVGGLGRGVFFRAKRHLARELMARQEALVIVGDKARFPLYDLSMNGVSFYAPKDGTDWPSGESMDIKITVRDRAHAHGGLPEEEVVYEGPARIARGEEKTGAVHVGLQLLGGFLDLPKIQWSYEERILRQDLQHGPEAVRKAVPEDFRRVIDRVAFFVKFYRQALQRHEARYTTMGDADLDAIRARAPRAVVDNLRGPWAELWEEATKIIEPYMADLRVVRAAKRFVEASVTPLIVEAPILDRSYNKPLGYAGDFITMIYAYRNEFEGSSIFSRTWHKLGCEEFTATGARTRRKMMTQYHEEEYDRFCATAHPSEPFRATSLGCGGAQELGDVLDKARDWKCPIQWTLIDQEEEALSFAYHALYPRVAGSTPEKSVRCMYMSFLQFLTDPSGVLDGEPQDLIYSTGLFDYIREARAKAIVEALYDALKPGGLLAIANVRAPNAHFAQIEFMVDWTMIYRTEEELMALTEKLPANAKREIAFIPPGAHHFILIRKPAV